MDKEWSFHEKESCLHRSGLITPEQERRMVCILIDQRGYKKSTHQNREEYPLGLFSLTLRLHSSGNNSPVEEKWMKFIQTTLMNGRRGSTNKRENNQERIRLPLSLFLVSESFTEKSSSYQREGAQWKIASDMLKDWAIFIGTTPQEFGKKWFIITKTLFWVYSIIITIVIIIFSLSY